MDRFRSRSGDYSVHLDSRVIAAIAGVECLPVQSGSGDRAQVEVAHMGTLLRLRPMNAGNIAADERWQN